MNTTLFPVRRTVRVKFVTIEQQMEAAQLPPWSSEYCFASHMGRRWRFDYAWPDVKVAFEQEGAVFGRSIQATDGKRYRVGGRHNSGTGLQADCEKYSWAAILGWKVIRATTTMIRDGKAIELLERALKP